MIKITIGHKKYTGIYRWDEMSLRQFVNLCAIPIPEGYEAYILADGKYDHTRHDSIDEYVRVVNSLTDEQIKKEFPEYYRKVILCLTNIPNHVLTDELVKELYELHYIPFVVSAIFNAPVISFMGSLKDYIPERVDYIKLHKDKYYLPESITITGIDVPLAKEPIISYLEAGDIFRDLKLSRQADKLSRFMGIYCRKKGEEYRDEYVLSRQLLFMECPMSVVWDVFFCIAVHLPVYLRTILLYGIRPMRLEDRREQVRHLLSTGVEV